MKQNTPIALSPYRSFTELQNNPSLTHFTTWVSHDDCMVIDLFTEDELGHLAVRYNGVELAVYIVTAQECDDYIVSLENHITLKGSPLYNKIRGI